MQYTIMLLIYNNASKIEWADDSNGLKVLLVRCNGQMTQMG